MKNSSLTELQNSYFRSFRNIDFDRPNSDDEDIWAWNEVFESVCNNPERGWKLILGLAEAAPDKEALAFIGADALEELLKRHGKNYLSRIQQEARRNKRFMYCLYFAWINSECDVHSKFSEIKKSLLDEYKILDEKTAESKLLIQ